MKFNSKGKKRNADGVADGVKKTEDRRRMTEEF